MWGDGAGTIWVGIRTGGLSRSDDGGQTWQTFTIEQGLGANDVTAVWGGGAGTVWVGTYSGGVSRSTDGGTSWQTFGMNQGLGADEVNSVWGDDRGVVWVGTDGGGLSRSDNGGATWQTFTTEQGLGSNDVEAVWVDRTGVVWAGTSRGTSRSDDGGVTWQTFSTTQGLGSNIVLSVWGDSQGVAWVGTAGAGGGVSRSANDGATWQTFTTAQGLGSNDVRSVWGDGQGTVWVGTNGGGVSRSDDAGDTWKTFTTAQGLGGNYVHSVWGDGQGTVWVGTYGGLSRSDDDGQSWQTFVTEQGLGDNDVQSVWGDGQGTVWVGTYGGLSRSDDDGQSWQTFTIGLGLGDNYVHSVWGDGQGTVWVGTWGGGLSRSDDTGATWQTFTTEQGLGDNDVRSVWGDGQGTVWVGTVGGGLSRSDDDGATWQTFTTAQGLGGNDVLSVWGDGQGAVWVGTYGGGLSRSDDGGQSWKTFTTAQGLGSNDVCSVWGDGQGTVWVATWMGGLSRSDDDGATWQTFTTAQGLGSNDVQSVWGDGQGIVWVGTWSGGLSRSTDDGQSWQTFTIAKGLGSNDVWSVWGDNQGIVWVGTFGGGLSRSDDDGQTWQIFTTEQGLGSNDVRSVWGDGQGTVWVSTWDWVGTADGGLSRSDDGGASWQTFTTTHGLGSNFVQSVWGDGQGAVWVGTSGGLSRSDDGGTSWQTFNTAQGLGSNNVQSVWGDGQGTVWVGTWGGGLSRSDDGGQSWQTFSMTQGLGSNDVQSVWGDGQGTVWAGTDGGGLSRSDDGGQSWQTFSTEHGLGSNLVLSVWGDGQGAVWVGTSGGLSRLTLATGPAPLAVWREPGQLAEEFSYRLLDTPTLEADFAGLGLTSLGTPDSASYAVDLVSRDGKSVFSDVFAPGEVGLTSLAPVALGPLDWGEYDLALVALDPLGRKSTTYRTVQVQARPLITAVQLYQEGVQCTDVITAGPEGDLGNLTVKLAITDPDSFVDNILIDFVDPADGVTWKRLGEDGFPVSLLDPGAHLLVFRATDPDGNSSLEPFALRLRVVIPPTAPFAPGWLLLGAVVALVGVGAAGFSLRRYPAYASEWTAAREYPLQQMIPLIAPSRNHMEGRGLLETLHHIQAFSTDDQVQEALDALARRGLLLMEDKAYRFTSPRTARVHAWLHRRHIPILAEQVRTQHPLYARTRSFFEQAHFHIKELDAEEFLFTPQGQAHPQARYGSIYTRLIAGRPPSGDDFSTVCEAARQRYGKGADLAHRAAVVISDHRPEPGARYRLYEIRQGEGLAIVPLDVTLFGQIKPNRTANDILAAEIDQATGRQNLYAISGPVSSDLSFFGRERVLQEIVDLLDAGQPVAIFGLRKAGKTSLILRLQGRLAQRRPIAPVDTQGSVRQQGVWPLYPAVMAAFAAHIQRTRPDVELPALRLWPEPGPPSPALAEPFLQDLRALHAALGHPGPEERLLLIVDEFDRLLPAGETPGYQGFAAFFGQLRAANQQAGLLDFILVGVDPALNRRERWRDHDNELYRALRELWMPPMESKAVREMIESLGWQMGVRYEPAALDLLGRVAGGHPFVTRQICSLAVEERLGAGTITVTAEQAREAIEEFIYRDPYLGEMWRTRLDDVQREMLRTLAQAAEAIPRTSLLPPAQRQQALAALDILEECTLVRQDEGGYVIAWEMLRDWVRWVELGL